MIDLYENFSCVNYLRIYIFLMDLYEKFYLGKLPENIYIYMIDLYENFTWRNHLRLYILPDGFV